jgi:O-antigen ligase
VKWVALIILLAAAMLLSWWLRREPNSVTKILMLMGFLPFALNLDLPFRLYMATISWPDWPGYVKGAEFSVLDAIALALYFGLPGARHPLPFRISMALYFVAALLSVFQASVPLGTLFYPWQLARMFLVYAAVARACSQPRGAPALLMGMVAGLTLQAGIAFWERFGLGIVQSGGTVHQNLLGVMSHFVVFPLFALLLAGRRGWLPVTGPLIGLAVEVLTTSRATIGLALFAYATMFALSVLRRWTFRKAQVLLFGVLCVVAITPLVVMSFDRRFAAEAPSNYDERAAFQRAASMMISDHPMGVGANQYVLVANVGGYDAVAGVAPTPGSLSTNVHNLYLLAAAETGYLGLIMLVLLLLRPMMAAFLCSWRHRGDQRGELLLGLGVALLTVYLHSFFEWIFVTFQAQYLFALDLGLVAGLTQQLGYWRHTGHSRIHFFQGARLGPGPSPIRSRKHSLEVGNDRAASGPIVVD